jgi:hypothetical protein
MGILFFDHRAHGMTKIHPPSVVQSRSERENNKATTLLQGRKAPSTDPAANGGTTQTKQKNKKKHENEKGKKRKGPSGSTSFFTDADVSRDRGVSSLYKNVWNKGEPPRCRNSSSGSYSDFTNEFRFRVHFPLLRPP